MREYPEYKPSNLPWLGDIPSHWAVWKVTHGFNRIGSGTTPKSDNPLFYDGTIPWITTTELREDTILDTSQKVTKEAVTLHSALKVYPQGSLAIAMYGATIGRLGILGIDATVNQACCVFSEPTVFDTRFVYYWLWMRRPVLISLSTGGGQPNLSQDDLKKLWIPVPRIGEQRAIVRFLDYKTAQIDALIAKKQSLLDKLAEQRTALISQAVTKGLDPSVPMKDSGVDWLGGIPAHWNMSKLRFVINHIEQGWSPQCHNQPADEEQWGVLKVGCVNGEKFNPYENKALPEDLKPRERYEIQSGDILVSRANTKELLGSAALVKTTRSKLLLCDKLYRIKPSNKVEPGYLLRFLRSSIARYQYEKDATGTSGSMQNIGQDTIKNLSLPLPPYLEQLSIAQKLEHEHAKSLMIEAKINSVVQRLQEYRSALITNAVTGKIDVRDYCIPTTTEQKEVAHG